MQQSLGDAPADALLPQGRPPLTGGLLGSAAKAVVVKRALAVVAASEGRHPELTLEAATAEHLDAAQLNSLSDAELQVRTRLLRDRIHQGWGLTGLWLIDTGVTAATVERTGPTRRHRLGGSRAGG